MTDGTTAVLTIPIGKAFSDDRTEFQAQAGSRMIASGRLHWCACRCCCLHLLDEFIDQRDGVSVPDQITQMIDGVEHDPSGMGSEDLLVLLAFNAVDDHGAGRRAIRQMLAVRAED